MTDKSQITSKTSSKWRGNKSDSLTLKIPPILPENLDSIVATIVQMMQWDILQSATGRSSRILEGKFWARCLMAITQPSLHMARQDQENLTQSKVRILKKDYYRCAWKPSSIKKSRTVEMG